MSDNQFKIIRPAFKCVHPKILINESLNTVLCEKCDESLNPIWVLARLSREGSRYEMAINEMRKTLKKADKKNKCKCEHCKKFTVIQR